MGKNVADYVVMGRRIFPRDMTNEEIDVRGMNVADAMKKITRVIEKPVEKTHEAEDEWEVKGDLVKELAESKWIRNLSIIYKNLCK